jgi:hypothetical protein
MYTQNGIQPYLILRRWWLADDEALPIPATRLRTNAERRIGRILRGHPSLFRPSQLTKDSARFFRSHDIAHVVFGLDTTLADEALADAWTLLGTDVGLRRYVRYLRTNPEAQQLMKQIGWARTTPDFSQGVATTLYSVASH